MTVTITGWLPTRLNELLNCHWRVGYQRKKADKAILALAFAGKRRAKRKRKLTVTWQMGPRNRQPDRDNIWKSLLDGLVACGQLVDDSPEWLDTSVVFTRGKVKATILTLEEI